MIPKLRLALCTALLSCLSAGAAWAQFDMRLILNNLSAFKQPTNNWKIVGSVQADLEQKHKMNSKEGKGVLLNQFKNPQESKDLYTTMEFADMDLDIEVMMAAGSNSGIYFMGRYEVQLFDSRGVTAPSFSDMGGVYQRWDKTKPKGEEGYEGVAPFTNACKAPGVWQRLQVEFKAPRFDAAGNKISNAKFLSVKLNGQPIHYNVELSGPTRGGLDGEVAQAPLRIQGDHGPVAFRNISVIKYGGKPVELNDIKYRFYTGKFYSMPDFSSLKPEKIGSQDKLSWRITNAWDDIAVVYTAIIKADSAGPHRFYVGTLGRRRMVINDKVVVDTNFKRRAAWTLDTALVNLKKGDNTLSLMLFKSDPKTGSGLQLLAEGPGFRKVSLQAPDSWTDNLPRKNFPYKATEATVFRGFLKYEGKDLPYTFALGSPDLMNLAINNQHGAVIQVWRGQMLDVGSLWHERGDQMMWPKGAVIKNHNKPGFAFINVKTDNWPKTINLTDYKFKGFRKDKKGWPTFNYLISGTEVNDRIASLENGKGYQREVKSNGRSIALLVAEENEITKLSETLYQIGEGGLFIEFNAGQKPILRNGENGTQQLIAETNPSADAQPLTFRYLW